MYQALYRKYRPQTFEDVVGQDGVTRILTSQLKTGRLSHAYLFTGSRGTGKTSCAKIMAKAVNCLDPQDGSPCNQCAACRSIDAGTCMDVLEIDAASNNGVDNIRDLRDDAIYSPSEVRYRVYIVDEVHMLSTSAFNALLKIMEEPPEHLIFILATTELHKVPATVLSRCQRFSFRRISPEDVSSRLQYIAYQEGIDLEPTASMVLGRMADGAMRDGVSLLDQCASATVGTVTEESVYQCLGLAGEQKAAALMDCIAAKNTKAALELYDRLYADGKDVAALLDELCALARDLLVLKTAPKSGISMLSGVCSDREALELKDKLSTGELVRITAALQETAAGFTRGGKTRLDGELCLIKLCQPELNLEADALNARLTRLEQAVASGVRVAPQKQEVPQAEEDDDRPPLPGDEDAPPMEGEAPAAPVQDDAPVGFWTDLRDSMKKNLSPTVAAKLNSSAVVGILCGDRVEIRCATKFSYDTLNRRDVGNAAREHASRILGRPVNVILVNMENKPQANASFRNLAERSKQYGDTVRIK